MLKPVVTALELPPFNGGCAHEEDLRTPVSEDLCHVRSANHKKRPLCAGCKSPYKARVMYAAGADVPDETVGAPGELEHKMKEYFQKNPPIRRQVRDDDDDEEVLDDSGQSEDFTSRAGEEQQGDANPTEGQGGSTPPVNQTEKRVRGRSKVFLRGDELFSTAAKVAKCGSENSTVRDICKRFDISEAQYYALIHIRKYPTEFRQLIVLHDFSLNTVVVLGKFPAALRGHLCDLLARRRLTTNALQEMLRLCKKDSDKMKSMCEGFGILWPQSLDDSGNKRL